MTCNNIIFNNNRERVREREGEKDSERKRDREKERVSNWYYFENTSMCENCVPNNNVL